MHDTVGTDLPDRATARREALGGLRDMINDELPARDDQVFGVDVRDDTHAVIYTARLTLAGHWLD